MYLWNKHEKIIIFGSGELAKQLYYIYKGQYDVMFFLDNYKNSNIFIENKNIYKYTKSIKKEYKIVIASSTHWIEISEQLINDGFQIYKNFAPYWMVKYDSIPYFSLFKIFKGKYANKIIYYMKKGKKIAIIHGNCQTWIIKKFLEKNKIFSEKYIFIDLPLIFQFQKEQLDIIRHDLLWKRCDLLITQIISNENKFNVELSNNSIYQMLDTNCKILTIPSLYFKGYFPQAIRNNTPFQKEIFPWRDKFVDSLFMKEKNINKILEIIKNESYISPTEIEDNINESFNELEKREKLLDITISDYIKLYYKEKQLFYDPYHPCNFLIKEIAIRILKFLNIQDITFKNEQIFDIDINYNLCGGSIPIYPFVIKTLRLKQYEKISYPNRYILPEEYFSFEEFIQRYIYICLYN